MTSAQSTDKYYRRHIPPELMHGPAGLRHSILELTKWMHSFTLKELEQELAKEWALGPDDTYRALNTLRRRGKLLYIYNRKMGRYQVIRFGEGRL